MTPSKVVLEYPEILVRYAFLWLLLETSCIVWEENSFLLHRVIIYLCISKAMLAESRNDDYVREYQKT